MYLLIPRTVFLIRFLEFPNTEERVLFPGAIGSIVLLCRLMGYLLVENEEKHDLVDQSILTDQSGYRPYILFS